MKEQFDAGYPVNPGTRIGEQCWTFNQYGFSVTWTWNGLRWSAEAIGVGTLNPNPVVYDFFGNPKLILETIDRYDEGYTKCDSPYYVRLNIQHCKGDGWSGS